jgi:DNA-directed RNA polymerase specialized sigma24 family protein
VSFREMKDYELDGLSDERLIAYVVRARRAGAMDAARLGLGVFANRRYDDLVFRASLRMPTREDAEDVAMRVIADIFKAAFEGQAVGEAVNFINRILQRRIADWYKTRKETEELPEEQSDDERKRPDAAVSGDGTGVVDVADVVAQVYARLESDHHRQAVDDYVFDGYNARETCDRVNNAYPELDPPMSEQNVHKIASRFRKELRSELDLD